MTRWSAHDKADDARSAALTLAASATTIDGEVRIVASAPDGAPRAAITDVGGLRDWDPVETELPAIKEEASWANQRVRAGLRGAILLTCRTALDRGVAAGLLSKAHAASTLGIVALAFDGEDPATVGRAAD